jgi:hypothetical protein
MKTTFFALCISFALVVQGQNKFTTLYKSIPTQSVSTAKQCFAASEVNSFDSHYSYVKSKDFDAFQEKVKTIVKPYTEATLAKGKAGTNPGVAAANDFSDLNSPEMQKKIAAMSKEEQIKFAMEIRARMDQNKNLQQVNAINAPDPLVNLAIKISTASTELIKSIPTFTTAAFPGYSPCGSCGELDDACAKKARICEEKIAKNFYSAQIQLYEKHMKGIMTNFNTKKLEYEKLLAQYDKESLKYTPNDINASATNVISSINGIATALLSNQEQGAKLIVEAKNNVYSKSEY